MKALMPSHINRSWIYETVGEIYKREQFPELNLIAGNVTSAEGVEFLACRANAIKVGQELAQSAQLESWLVLACLK